MKNINYKIQKICLTAVFASLITVCIFSLKLPIASMQGYIHPGDFIIYLSTVFCGPYSLICSALGGALADIISGFPVWAFPTAIIKALNCVPFLLINKKSDKCKNKILNRYSVGALIVSSFITVFGYMFFEIFLYSFPTALADIPGNTIQALASAALYIVAGAAFKNRNFKTHM